MKRLLCIAGLLASSHAGASGYNPPSYTYYKAFSVPDIAPARFQEGHLGVLQPGMQRVYLYTAWRAMMLGPKVRSAAGRPGGLARANGQAFGFSGANDGSDAQTLQAWRDATGRRESSFDACPSSSTAFALETLKRIRTRKDATPALLRGWIGAQEQVSSACKAEQEARYRSAAALAGVDIPAPLPGSEPLYWQQLREYQRAAALFHTRQYLDAATWFDKIAAAPGHPMQDLGGYLALRAQVRRAASPDPGQTDAGRKENYDALHARAQAILADPALAVRHEATRATLRSIRARLMPQAVLADLNQALADPTADPFADDRLGDWVAVLRQGDGLPTEGADRLKAARDKYDFVAWMENLHDCAYRRPLKDQGCTASARRASAQWQRTGSRPWLAATLMLSASFKPGMEAAALAVQPSDPEYLTVRCHLARLYRLAGRVADARAVSDAALKLDMPHGSRNLFREERFAVATSIADAAPYMQRAFVRELDNDEVTQGFNNDATAFMFSGLSAAGMVVLARQEVLPVDVRARLAASAWTRAELLGARDVALQAGAVLEPLVPEMKPELAAYRSASAPAGRRHVMVLAALRFKLSPQIDVEFLPLKPMAKEDMTASGWCRFRHESEWLDKPVAFPWLLPAPLALGDQKSARAEVNSLMRLKTATGFIGDHVLLRAQTNPGDPDLPWLLHLVVKSTRGPCLDPDAKQLSRKAFHVLHQRYPGNEWTLKTPYYY